MLDPRELYEVAVAPGELAGLGSPVLVHGIAGFVDAGGATRLVGRHLLETLEHRTLATFDVDQLLDYRSRRPPMIFDADHWESYADPRLVLHLVHDAAGAPFLYLEGQEPDVQWERFVAAVTQLVQAYGVRLSIGLNAIPMAVPHTRPIGVTAHATRKELIAGYEPWVGMVQVPGHAAALLEYRLGQAGRDAMGFAVHVPHYLAQADFPDAAVALLEAVTAQTGLALPADTLRVAAGTTRAEIDAQVARSEEVSQVVAALEQQYDAYAGSRGRPTLLAQEADLPSADELGAELERFLREQGR